VVNFFNKGCNEQVFKILIKNLAQVRLVVFEITAKKTYVYFRKMTSPSERLGYSNNQLNCMITGWKSVSGFPKPWFPKAWN